MNCLKQRKLSTAEKKALEREINSQLADYIRKFEKQIDAIVLYVLHSKFGWGQKRLREFYDAFQPALNSLQQHYEMGVGDQSWLCDRKLKEN